MRMGAEGLEKQPLTSEVPSAERIVSGNAWLDRLLVAFADLRPGGTIEEACSSLLDAVIDELPYGAPGVCVPGGESGQVVVRRSSRETETSPDPTRLFPEFRHERVVPIHFDDGSTLHLAADEEERISGGGTIDLFVERLAHVL